MGGQFTHFNVQDSVLTFWDKEIKESFQGIKLAIL